MSHASECTATNASQSLLLMPSLAKLIPALALAPQHVQQGVRRRCDGTMSSRGACTDLSKVLGALGGPPLPARLPTRYCRHCPVRMDMTIEHISKDSLQFCLNTVGDIAGGATRTKCTHVGYQVFRGRIALEKEFLGICQTKHVFNFKLDGR